MEVVRCKRCKRKLKGEESKRRGYGDICYKKAMQQRDKYHSLFDLKPLMKAGGEDENNK